MCLKSGICVSGTPTPLFPREVPWVTWPEVGRSGGWGAECDVWRCGMVRGGWWWEEWSMTAWHLSLPPSEVVMETAYSCSSEAGVSGALGVGWGLPPSWRWSLHPWEACAWNALVLFGPLCPSPVLRILDHFKLLPAKSHFIKGAFVQSGLDNWAVTPLERLSSWPTWETAMAEKDASLWTVPWGQKRAVI